MTFAARSAAASAAAFFFLAAPARAADPQLCAACHGPNGNSQIPANPSIAQQPRQFIETALYQFREGNRKNEQMSPMAEKLSNAELRELGKFFSEQKAAPPQHKTGAEAAAAGPGLAEKYNCVQCHGPKLMGQQHIPRIAGQQYDYLRVQLHLFKAGKRADIDGNMTSAAKSASEQELDTLADYVAGLSPQ
ncbi:MAG: c-type cytochrome [Betaproteobacteria bacterium]|nr:c-type cytochrome [Betaproteobacteria bacterium]